ncbi:MAG TPA: SAM-dependent methyltransferase [Xanthomonadales bacterium]|nr:SAM-dependent methyltransferase [Xanthomonadales bacterium]
MSRSILPEPPEELKQLSLALRDKILLEIAADGLIPFRRFMEMALYEPGLGYYSAGLHKFGASGDFVTAPELGSLFAATLARQLGQVADELGAYDILELGAGTGRLCADLLNNLAKDHQPNRYLILERSADLRSVQQHVIAAQVPNWQDRVKWISQPLTEPWDGVLLANEMIDALAVERFRIGVNGIEQLCVGFKDEQFTWRHRAAPKDLDQAVYSLGLTRQEAYVSEINLRLEDWLKTVSDGLRKGLALFIDYGYPQSEYYLEERRQGTLMCHYRHRAHDNVFFWPGLQDITAFVDFTALAESAERCGLDMAGYTSQSMFLLACGIDKIIGRQIMKDESAALNIRAEARQLTMPDCMGERFQVMALTRQLDLPLTGFTLRDLRHRL